MSRANVQVPFPAVAVHGGIDLPQFFTGNMVAAGFPMAAGIAIFGWRAILVLVTAIASTLLGTLIWRRIGRRGGHIRFAHATWMGMILALALPAHLAVSHGHALAPTAAWPLVPAGGLLLALAIWVLGGIGLRLHPVPVVYLLLVVIAGSMLVPHYVLRRDKLVSGDVVDAVPRRDSDAGNEPWAVAAPPPRGSDDALWRRPPSEMLTAFTRGQPDPARAWLSLDGLVRDEMPPLEDLIIGGQPAAIGSASAIAVIMGGLFLVYRGLINFRVPLLIAVSAYAALLLLPIPIVLTEGAAPQWHWAVMRQPSVGWSLGITFANYELMAGPLLFVAFFLASSPGARPMARSAQSVYAVLLGLAAGTLQLYLSVSYGPYLALLGVGLLSPLIDRWFKPRPIV